MKRKKTTLAIIIIALAFILIFAILSPLNKSGTFEVNSKKSTIYITVPTKYNPSKKLSLIFDEYGFSYNKTDKEGDVTYSISKDSYKAFLEDTKKSINDYIDSINNGDISQTIESISINDNYSTITVCVNKEAFNESTDDLSVNALALKAAMYQGYKGNDICVKIKYKDINTNKVYDDVTIK